MRGASSGGTFSRPHSRRGVAKAVAASPPLAAARCASCVAFSMVDGGGGAGNSVLSSRSVSRTARWPWTVRAIAALGPVSCATLSASSASRSGTLKRRRWPSLHRKASWAWAPEGVARSHRVSDRQGLRGNQHVQDTFNMVTSEQMWRERSAPDLWRSSSREAHSVSTERARKRPRFEGELNEFFEGCSSADPNQWLFSTQVAYWRRAVFDAPSSVETNQPLVRGRPEQP